MSYHSHHSPLGAFASFTLGFENNSGGFGHALRGPARQNVYVGFRRGDGPFQLLPFFVAPERSESAFTAEAATPSIPSNVSVIPAHEITRELGWASDTWGADAGRFLFELLSPFGITPDPEQLKRSEARLAFSPHVSANVAYDNRAGDETVQLIFGVGDPDHVFHPLQDSDPALQGFALGTRFAYATTQSSNVESRQGFNVFEPKYRDYHGLCLLGGESALLFEVAPGETRQFPIALAFYHDGAATTGIATRYAYTRWFTDIHDVLRHALKQHAHYESLARARDHELRASKLGPDQQFLLAHATHSYLGSTQLLWGEQGPIWVVNEGEYRMMNTFDLTVDHLFFELRFLPWAVRNTLDLYVDRYSYRDRLQIAGDTKKGGISFTHDMGVDNSFTPIGRSSYECDNLTGCFSHMTSEQLLNWVLCAVSYGLHSGDKSWLKKQKRTMLDCAESLRRRDNPKEKLRNGILKHDSTRCGNLGSEITTYDSLDVSLGQARNNLYLSVKNLGAWLLLHAGFGALRLEKEAAAALFEAERLANSLCERFDATSGSFPAVFEHENESRIIPAVEGLVYPLFLRLTTLDPSGPLAQLLPLLEKHLCSTLRPGVCIDSESGGWKMSSTSTNTWFSKTAIAQHVVRQLFPSALNGEAARGDAVHAAWQRGPSCGAHAFCDQIRSNSGETCGSRYYPRGVTAILWLDNERQSLAATAETSVPAS